MYDSRKYLKQKNPHKDLSNFLTVCVFSSVIHLPEKKQLSLDYVGAEAYVSHMIPYFTCQ